MSKCVNSKSDYVRINIKVPRALHKELRLKAVDSSVTLQFMCNKIFEDYIKEGD